MIKEVKTSKKLIGTIFKVISRGLSSRNLQKAFIRARLLEVKKIRAQCLDLLPNQEALYQISRTN